MRILHHQNGTYYFVESVDLSVFAARAYGPYFLRLCILFKATTLNKTLLASEHVSLGFH